MQDTILRTTAILIFLMATLATTAGAQDGLPMTPECLTPEAAGPLTKQMLSLAFTTYLEETYINTDQTLDQKIRPCFNKALKILPELEGSWKRVWGPYVSKFTDVKYTDNLLFAAELDPSGEDDVSIRQLAIAIRGTNYVSLSDWLVEDFEIKKMVAWTPGGGTPDGIETCAGRKPSKRDSRKIPLMAQGTCRGLQALLELGSQNAAGEAPILHYVRKWLDESDGRPSEIYVTGHSLGGTLTPVLALWLHEQLAKAGEQVSIKTYSFAGLTPGNRRFADLVENQLGLENIHRIHNPLDVAPYGWTRELRQTAFGLYSPPSRPRAESNPVNACKSDSGHGLSTCNKPDLHPNVIERLLFDYFNDEIKGHDYAQVNAGYPPLCETIMPIEEATYAKQGFWQHHYGYLYGLDMLTQDDGICTPCAASMTQNFCNEAGLASDDG